LAIAAQDQAFITQADGVGPKLALRILTELKDKAANMQIGNAGKPVSYSKIVEEIEGPKGLDQDAVSALVNLGYRRAEAQSAIAKALDRLGDAPSIDAVIREGLKELAR
jgi:Holliday junction DNA helicase RuvA